MKFILLNLVVSLLFISCGVKKIEFKNKYKFNSEILNQVEKDTVPWKFQVAASDFTMKGGYFQALTMWDKGQGVIDDNYTMKQIDSIRVKYKIVPAIEYITKQAKKNKILIINEAHHNSLHRVFTESLLKELYNIGYRSIGFEALGVGKHKDSLLDERKSPILKTGYYTKDPRFGNLIRTAYNIGYHVFGYETTTGANGKEREIEQAKNIYKIIESKPNEKFVIHCGFDHVLEGNHDFFEKAMASRLSELSGINPFTVNQVPYTEKSEPKYDDKLLKVFNLKQSSVLIDKKNNPFKYKRNESWADIVVFHPNTKIIKGRPNWVFSNKRIPVNIELDKLDLEYPIMILAYQKRDDINEAVPIDIIEVKNKKEPVFLALTKGKYQIIITNMKNKSLKMKIKIK